MGDGPGVGSAVWWEAQRRLRDGQGQAVAGAWPCGTTRRETSPRRVWYLVYLCHVFRVEADRCPLRA